MTPSSLKSDPSSNAYCDKSGTPFPSQSAEPYSTDSPSTVGIWNGTLVFNIAPDKLNPVG